MRVSKSFVIDADAVKVYDVARDFFVNNDYKEQNTVRPTLLLLKRRIKVSDSSGEREYRINLRASFNPVGNLQIYSAALVAVRCEYDIKVSETATASNDKKMFESEVERLRCHITNQLRPPIIAPSVAKSCESISREQKAVDSEESKQSDIRAVLIQQESEIRIGEELNFEILIENVGNKTLLLTKVEKLFPNGFQLVDKPKNSYLHDSQLRFAGERRLPPKGKVGLEIVIKSFNTGTFVIKPTINYQYEDKHEDCIELEPKTIYVLDKILPGRIATGYKELDTLMFGGVPEKYAVLMTSSSNDERDQIIKKFLTTGAEAGQITFYIAVEPGSGKILAEKFQKNFYLFVCNPRADLLIDNLPNVFKISGVENLSEIEIALTKSLRHLDVSKKGPRRACIEIISDVLLQHHAVITRKWLSRLLPEMKSKGFTTLAIVNPHMHPKEEVHALLGLFEGEIKISEKETEKGIEKSLRIGKLYNLSYLQSVIPLKKKECSLEGSY